MIKEVLTATLYLKYKREEGITLLVEAQSVVKLNWINQVEPYCSMMTRKYVHSIENYARQHGFDSVTRYYDFILAYSCEEKSYSTMKTPLQPNPACKADYKAKINATICVHGK